MTYIAAITELEPHQVDVTRLLVALLDRHLAFLRGLVERLRSRLLAYVSWQDRDVAALTMTLAQLIVVLHHVEGVDGVLELWSYGALTT